MAINLENFAGVSGKIAAKGYFMEALCKNNRPDVSVKTTGRLLRLAKALPALSELVKKISQLLKCGKGFFFCFTHSDLAFAGIIMVFVKL